MQNKIIAIIPARGGSKGIPKKNIQQLAGKPLIYYSIKAARESRLIDAIFVSSDDDEVLRIAESFGAAAIKRPDSISGDESPTIDTIFYVLEQCAIIEYKPEIIVLLQPTSPLRTSSDIDSALELFIKNECDSVISVVKAGHPPHWNMMLEGNYLKPLMGQQYFTMRRQELPKTYLPNGAIFIATPKTLEVYHSFYCPKTIPYIMSSEKSVDIDSKFDLDIAEEIMRNGEDSYKGNSD